MLSPFYFYDAATHRVSKATEQKLILPLCSQVGLPISCRPDKVGNEQHYPDKVTSSHICSIRFHKPYGYTYSSDTEA